ncbi:MAG: DUF3570 domain-containing protein [Proteobacteria bacterium]|nr:DUF3570 domain-containing protein [Pseudomonadota bacterium]
MKRTQPGARSGPSRTLRALASSAVALPGLAGSAAADGPAAAISADYNFTFYSEDANSPGKTVGNDRDRFDIEMHQFYVDAPLSDRTDLKLNLTYETLSGATPWFIAPDEDGNAIQTLTGASIEEDRIDVSLKGNYYYPTSRVGLTVGVSDENDYRAVYAGVDFDRDLFDKHTTLSGGLTFSIDKIEPTDADDFVTRPSSEEKKTVSLFAGVSQILTRTSAAQVNFAYQHATDYLSDPYKQVYVRGVFVSDSRPDSRNQIALLGRYRHHFEFLNGTAHADYRLYWDDWEVSSHTISLAWYQTFFERIRLIPSFRYYTQSAAEFYEPFFNDEREDGFYSSDYRLSPYGAFAFRLRGEIDFRDWSGLVDWRANVSWERYIADSAFALGTVDVENPGLVSFNLISVGLEARF